MTDNNKLLKLLEEDCTYTQEQLASMADMPLEDVKAAIKRYEEEKIVLGYKAIVDWDRTQEESVTALIEVKVTPQRNEGFDRVAERIYQYDEVESVYLMSGGYDLAVTVTGKTMSDIAMFVSKRLATIDGVLSTATHFVLTKYKDGGVVFASDYEEIDERGSNLCD